MGAKVGVLLAAYNGRAWIGHQVNSILAQDSVDVTLFVSVDRSDDGTEQFIDQLSLGEKRISILPHGKRFGGAGPNFYRLISEVDFSGFDYVAFADQDDIWLPNKLSRACDQLAESGADAYSSNVTAFWPDGRQVLVNKSQPQVRWDFLFEAAAPGCTYVMTIELARELQAFIMKNSKKVQKIAMHDWFTYAFARARGYRWVIDSYPGMRYRQHAQNQVGANSGLRAFVYRAGRVLDGWGLGQSALIADALGLLKDPPVKAWLSGTRIGYLRLALNFWQCRRRLRDKFLFLGACLMLAAIGSKIKK
jgi:rhamnosyltransferase